FNDTATTEIYTLSLHDALPIYLRVVSCRFQSSWGSLYCISSNKYNFLLACGVKTDNLYLCALLQFFIVDASPPLHADFLSELRVSVFGLAGLAPRRGLGAKRCQKVPKGAKRCQK